MYKNLLLFSLALLAAPAQASNTQVYPCFSNTQNLLSCLISNYSIVWPINQGGANTSLINDGSGNLTWGVVSNPSGGTIGGPVAGGNPQSVLFVDSSGNLGQDTGFVFTGGLGIGTASPAAALDVHGTFQVNSSGNLVTLNGVHQDWPGSQGGADTFLENDGSGGLTWGTVTAGITALTGDVSASGAGSVAATVNSVGGSSAASVNTATVAVAAATSADTPSTLVARDGSGNFSANDVTLNTLTLPVTSSSSVGVIAQSGVSIFSTYGGNVFLGPSTGNFTTTGNNNIGIGDGAEGNITGHHNIGIGSSSVGNPSADDNIGIGDTTLPQTVTGGANIALGSNSLFDNSSGNENIAIGAHTGGGIVSGSENVIIGGHVGGLSSTLANNIILADGAGNIKARNDGTNWTMTGNVALPGNLTEINGVTTNFPGTQGGASTVLVNDGSGNLTWGSAISSLIVGSTPVASSGTSQILYVNGSGILESTTTLVDTSAVSSANVQSRTLLDSSGLTSIQWGSRHALWPDGSTVAFDWHTQGSFGLNGVEYAWPGTQGGMSTVLQNDGSGNLSWAAAGGVGTVTSVSFTDSGGIFSITGSPVTSSGTIAESVTGTSGGIPYFFSGSTLHSSAALTANAVVVGGGAGAAPAVVTNNSSATKEFLTQTSSGAPAWGTIAAADVPAATSSAVGTVSFEVASTQSIAFTGPCGVAAITVRYSRTGKNAAVFVPSFSCSAATSNAAFVASSNLPSTMFPAVNAITACAVESNTVNQTSPGYIEITSSGTISVGFNWGGGSYSTSGTAGAPSGCTIAYTVE